MSVIYVSSDCSKAATIKSFDHSTDVVAYKDCDNGQVYVAKWLDFLSEFTGITNTMTHHSKQSDGYKE